MKCSGVVAGQLTADQGTKTVAGDSVAADAEEDQILLARGDSVQTAQKPAGQNFAGRRMAGINIRNLSFSHFEHETTFL